MQNKEYIAKISTPNKRAIVITDGVPDDGEVTAIIIIDKNDYPIYREIALECDDLCAALKELTNHNVNFELITDIDKEYGFYFW